MMDRESDRLDERGVDSGPAAREQAAAGRRRFLRGSAAGGIVALTVLGRPAWAGHCSYSGRMSGNLSAQSDEPCGGEGYSPGYWKTHLYDWHENWPPHMSFYATFRIDAYPGRSLKQVIWGDCGLVAPRDGHPRYVNMARELGVQACAALQNAATPVNYLLTVSEVIDSFVRAYRTRDPRLMELTKNSFDRLNNLSA